MSFNITSEGSPTPRKGPARFVMGEELKINTSPEVLGMAAVGPRTHPFTQYRPISASLTSSWQGMKRPLGPSAHANQSMPTLQQNQLDGFKVSAAGQTLFSEPSSVIIPLPISTPQFFHQIIILTHPPLILSLYHRLLVAITTSVVEFPVCTSITHQYSHC